MSREYISAADVPEETVWALRSIAEILEDIAASLRRIEAKMATQDAPKGD